MKNLLKKSLASAMTIMCTALPIINVIDYNSSAVIYYGDVSGDGRVDEEDVILLQKYFTGKAEEQPVLTAADMDDDNDIDIFDIIFLKRYLLYDVMPGEKPGEVNDAEKQARGYALEIVALVNEQRAAAGVAPVEFNEDLFGASMIRADELTQLFSHTRPNGESCFEILDGIGYGNRWCAENIAAGSSTPEGVMNQWIKSSGHYQNMIGERYTQIGVGFVYDPDSEYKYYWVQIFTS